MFYAGPSTSIRSVVRAYRRNPTEAERILWAALRGRKLRDLRFRRQHPIAGYIVDFYCAEAKLAIEIDGSVHEGTAARARDAARTATLEAYGVRVIRFTNDDVVRQLPLLLDAIARQVFG